MLTKIPLSSIWDWKTWGFLKPMMYKISPKHCGKSFLLLAVFGKYAFVTGRISGSYGQRKRSCGWFRRASVYACAGTGSPENHCKAQQCLPYAGRNHRIVLQIDRKNRWGKFCSLSAFLYRLRKESDHWEKRIFQQRMQNAGSGRHHHRRRHPAGT